MKDMMLKQGVWRSLTQPYKIITILGDSFEISYLIKLDYPDVIKSVANGKISLGDFGPVKDQLKERFGQSAKYNVALTMIEPQNMTINSFLDESGTMMTYWGFINMPETYVWLSDDELRQVLDNRESIFSPSCPHIQIQPEKQGKIYWLSGPPTSGKSTTCQLMARKKGFVYYEADCTMIFVNPFVDPNVENPSVAGWCQPPLKDLTIEDIEAIRRGCDLSRDKSAGNFDNLDENYIPVTMAMARDIKRQKQRIGGGDWAVAQAVMSRHQRDQLKEKLGPDLVFIVLNMTRSCQEMRIKARHGVHDNETESPAFDMIKKMMTKMYDLYQPAGSDEVNAYNVDIDEFMSPDDVLNKVLDVIAQIEQKDNNNKNNEMTSC